MGDEKIHIGIVGPSSKVPKVELKLGIQKIRNAGFHVDVHDNCKKSFLFFAGTDEERATSFYEYANHPKLSVLWCARGGYGAIRLLPHLEKLSSQGKLPDQKLLVGYSDSTALMEYVRSRWGWAILHAPMPSMRKFSFLPEKDWVAMTRWFRKKATESPWQNKRLTFWVNQPKRALQGTLLGGNLTVWNSLVGTRFQPKTEKTILFFEDIDENIYRIDRMLQQQILSGALDKVQAIVLGNFMNCRDISPLVLKTTPSVKQLKRVLLTPKPQELKPLRRVLKDEPTLRKIWSDIGERLGIPVAFGLPVGHGPELSPLPLGAKFQLNPDGSLELTDWNWLEKDFD